MSDSQANKCPLCDTPIGMWNATFKKYNGERICGKCVVKLQTLYPQLRKYDDISLDKLRDDVKYYTPPTQPVATTPITEPTPAPKVSKKALCPKCKSQNIVPVGHKPKNISLGKAAGGAVLLGGVGLAAGLMGKTEKKMEFYCQDCGKQFKR